MRTFQYAVPMSTTTTWWSYLRGITNGASNVEVARKVGFHESNMSKWSKGSKPDFEFVVKIAHAYRVNVLEALVAAGYLSEADANLREVKVGLSDLSTADLAREIAARLDDPE